MQKTSSILEEMTGIWRCTCKIKRCCERVGGGRMVSRASAFRHALADGIANAASCTTPVRLRIGEEMLMEYDVQDLVTSSAASMREDEAEHAAVEV